MLGGLRGLASFGRESEAEADPTAGELIYAVGDVHGRYDLLKQLMVLIREDWVRQGSHRRPVIIFCGDYVDRGPDSAAVIEAMVWLQQRTDIQARFLKGNHEAAFMRFLHGPTDSASWLRFGWVETSSLTAWTRPCRTIPPAVSAPGTCCWSACRRPTSVFSSAWS